MTETIVKIRDRQEVTADDLSGMGQFARDGVDNVVGDGITDERRYVDLTVTEESSTSVRIAIGRLYDTGAVYAHDTETVLSMTAAPVGIPVVNKKLVAIYAYGQAVDTNAEARDFLIDPETDVAEPDVVTTRERRICYMGAKAGTESVNPILPALPDNSCLVAVVTISPTGIDSIVMEASTRLDSVESVADRTKSLEVFRDGAEFAVGALASEFSSLSELTDGKADAYDMERLQALIDEIWEHLNRPTTYSEIFTDDFANDSNIDTVASAGTYLIGADTGLMFPEGAKDTLPLALLNPIDPLVYRSGTDFIIPAKTDQVTVECPGHVGEQSITEFSATTIESKQFTGTKSETRYGTTPGSSYTTQEITGYENRATGYGYNPNGTMYIKSVRVPVYKTVHHTTPGKQYSYQVQVPYTYYEDVESSVTYNGSMLGQTFITKRAGWGTGLGLYFTKIAPAGDVHVFITGTTDGKPDPEKVLAKTTVPQANLKAFPEETFVELPLHLMDSGARIGFIVQSEGAHSLARGEPTFTEGTFFFGSGGVFFQGDANKDIKFRYYMASFASPRTEVVLEPLSLTGGISDMYISTEQPALPGTSLIYEVQIAGVWKSLSQLDNFAGLPNLVPFRLVMLGTTDLQPGYQLGADRVTVFRPGLSQTVISTAILLLGADKQNWVVDVTLFGWVDNVNQTIDCKLLHGASFATETDASATDENIGSDGRARFRFTFDAGAPISTAKVKILGTRTAAGVPYRTIKRTAIAVS